MKRSMNDTVKIPVHTALKTDDYRVELFVHFLNTTRSNIIRRIGILLPATSESVFSIMATWATQ